MLYPSGLEFICAFFGCLYAGVIAVPAYPPGKSRLVQNVKRLELLSRNCTPAVVLCDDDIRGVLTDSLTDEIQQAVLAQIEHNTSLDDSSLEFLKAKVISTIHINELISESIIITPSLHDLAFLQYTSGSTGNPKGVMVNHINLMENSALIKKSYAHTDMSVGVEWLPPYHDMGLIGSILQPIFMGFLCNIMPPVSFLRDPILWIRHISNFIFNIHFFYIWINKRFFRSRLAFFSNGTFDTCYRAYSCHFSNGSTYYLFQHCSIY